MTAQIRPFPPWLSLLFSAIGMVLYVGFCCIAFHNSVLVAKLQNHKLKEDWVAEALHYPVLHDALFFRKAAQELQSVKHDPTVALRLSQIALVKAPAAYESFFVLARQIMARNCCKEQILLLLNEAVRRNPRDPRVFSSAGSLLLRMDGNQADAFFRKALEINPSLAINIYDLLQEQKGTAQDLVSITPKTEQNLLSLAVYLSSKRMKGAELNEVLRELVLMPLNPAQRLVVARTAIKAEAYDVAQAQASAALQESTTELDALKLLAEISLQRKKWDDFQSVTATIRKKYMQAGKEKDLAAFQLGIAERLSQEGHTDQAMEMLSRITDEDRSNAHAYFLMGRIQRKTDLEAATLNLKRAVALRPAEFSYSQQLADLYFKLKRFPEVEQLYAPFLASARHREGAYLGIAYARAAAGDRKSAISILKEAIQKIGKTKGLLFELGTQYENEGQLSLAKEQYEKTLEINPSDKKAQAALLRVQTSAK
jgi:tetratricopeptide (TPR) repeat protein